MRATPTSVRAVIQTALTDGEIDPLIAQANRIVNSTTETSGLSEELLTDIESWLTAHLIAIGKERQTVGEKLGDVWVQYDKRDQFKSFLELTQYGQMVLFLDPTGAFQKSSLKRASIKAYKQESCD